MALRVASFLLLLTVAACTRTPTNVSAPPSAPSPSPSSPSPTVLVCTVEGTPKADKLAGTPSDDVICGLGGDDTIRGGDGNDTMRGGLGNDMLLPGPGDNTLDGGPGRDRASYASSKVPLDANLRGGIVTTAGTDTFVAIEGLIATALDDVITGSIHDDTVDGGDGNDTIHLLDGDDTAVGGAGDDTLLGSDGIDTCVQGPGSGKVSCERSFTPVPFAKVGKVVLMVPARDPMLLAYHESLFKSAATMKPLGDRKAWLIQPSRGRGTAATSAIDIPLEPHASVLAPIDGTVIDVIEYPLYCEALDTLVVIRPRDDHDVSVIVMHLDEVQVHKGDDVYAGGTVLGQPHVFAGGTNQVDAYVPGSPPHVHVEVESDGSKVVPGCEFARVGSDDNEDKAKEKT